jgi:hypothetical protein
MATRGLVAVGVTFITLTTACASVTSYTNASTRTGAPPAAVATSTQSTASLLRPCSFLTQQTAATISGDAAVTDQAFNVLEPISGYVACIYTDGHREADSVSVQIESARVGGGPSALRHAATFFEGGEPSQPYVAFLAVGIGESALGEAIPGAAFVVFATQDRLVYVGARSSVVKAGALRSGVEGLAAHVAAALDSAIDSQP